MVVPLAKRTTVPNADIAIATCCVVFIIILAVSAYWDASIRTLHVFEAVPYAAGAILSMRRRKIGYAIIFASGAFWLCYAATLVTFVRNGFEQIAILLRTGQIQRADVLIAVPATIATGGMVILSVVAYSGLRSKSWKDVGVLTAVFVGVVAFFIAIFSAFAPQYLVPLRRFLDL